MFEFNVKKNLTKGREGEEEEEDQVRFGALMYNQNLQYYSMCAKSGVAKIV